MKYTKFIFINNNSDTLDVILHGKSSGIDSDFIQKLIKASDSHNNNILAFNFPYMDRQDTDTKKSDLVEEVGYLKKMIEFSNQLPCENIRLIGKSFGAIVANQFLANYKSQNINKNISLHILGCFIEDIHLDCITNKVVIIQGDQDKYCPMDTLKEKIKKATSDIKLHIINGADHSFKDPETNKPKYIDEAINFLF